MIACYAIEPARLPQVVTARLRAMGVSIDQDAAAWCGQNLSGEEGPLGQALEVLFLYAGESKALSLADVSAALTDGGDTSMGDAIDAALTGDPAATDKALALAYEEGVSPVGLIRVLLGELLRLRVAAGAMADGASAQEAMAGMRPPVFFKRQATVQKMLRLWPLSGAGPGNRRRFGSRGGVQDHAYPRPGLLPADLAGLGLAGAHRSPPVSNFNNLAWKSGANAPRGAVAHRFSR